MHCLCMVWILCVVPWPYVSTLASEPDRDHTRERRNPLPRSALQLDLQPTKEEKRGSKWLEEELGLRLQEFTSCTTVRII